MTKWVYGFGGNATDGDATMRELLGGKGANLAEMAKLGLPVPPGFTVTTEVCTHYYANGKYLPSDLSDQMHAALDLIAGKTGKAFGDPANPLLLSVRSGARVSMPGMMDTVLNLGLNDETVVSLGEKTQNPRFAWDSYRRFIQMYGDVVMGLDHHDFEDILEDIKAANGASEDTDLTAEHLQDVATRYKEMVESELETPFPEDPFDQLMGAVGAVFSSWMVPRAITYRKLHDIPEDWGTAVNVQAMVFGNTGDTSATGVAFTRNPSTGENELYGEFLINAQGEDVVAGIRTPQNITEKARMDAGSEKASLEAAMPSAFGEFTAICEKLETHFRDMQDMEFTIEDGTLWMLQTRNGKRTTKAALRCAVDMANEGLITRNEAIKRIDPAALDQLLHPTIAPGATRDLLGKGLPASPGAASGSIVFDSDEAEAEKAKGEAVILCRAETSPEDIHGMHAALGILTTRGGMTSHAAVVARGMGKPCVSGAGGLRIDQKTETLTCAGRTFKKGDRITIDGSTGEVLAGDVEMVQPELSGDFATLMSWADETRRMTVRANAETPGDARTARSFGAEGIGLCRTEHMFFAGDRILTMRQMILSDDEAGRRAALDKLLPMQRADFIELFEIMAGLPVTIRLLDPPLHEFLPHGEAEVAEVAGAMDLDTEILRQRIEALQEFNPMLGHRGCRLAISYPEITEMQARAIFEAALDAEKKTGEAVILEVMVPLVATVKELDLLADRVDAVAKAVADERGRPVTYQIGTMIELPRAALRAGQIAERAEFFSFGTNDLTQTTFGISRDDAANFLGAYTMRGVLADDPFVTIDVNGVGELVEMASTRGKATRPDIKLGICGEHGGDPRSVTFCETIGLDYVSCSPFRVPIARLAAAQATIED
ncbi:MAG: pyruvate, phosphate dikinase [Pseudomonadota bacterium]